MFGEGFQHFRYYFLRGQIPEFLSQYRQTNVGWVNFTLPLHFNKGVHLMYFRIAVSTRRYPLTPKDIATLEKT